jgi:prepilin-type N-terminal cleavage/methylation domain-containing protein
MPGHDSDEAAVTAAGFSLVELLVALTVCALLSGAIAAAAPPARRIFESTPGALEMQQREHTATDVLTHALRSAPHLAVARDDGTVGQAAPAVELQEPDAAGPWFHALRVVVIAGHGRGVLLADQASPAAALQLRSGAQCPSSGEVCGFSKGMAVAIVDTDGRLDLFTIAAVNTGSHSLIPTAALDRAYPAGSGLWAVSADTYYLNLEADGSSTLVRETVAGAVQPIVDVVAQMDLRAVRRAGLLARVDLVVSVGARAATPSQGMAARTRRVSVSMRNPS